MLKFKIIYGILNARDYKQRTMNYGKTEKK